MSKPAPPSAVTIPRVNTNDDQATLLAIHVTPGETVTEGTLLAELETAKAVVEITAPRSGTILRIELTATTSVTVGSTLLWIGDSDAPLPPPAPPATPSPHRGLSTTRPASAKALELLKQHGLTVADLPPGTERIGVEAVQLFLARREPPSTPEAIPASATPTAPFAMGVAPPSDSIPLTGAEHGVITTLAWQRQEAVPAYVEVPFAHQPWRESATALATRERLLFDPLLGLLAWRLVAAVERFPRINGVIAGQRRLVYRTVNLGFMVQGREQVVMVVIKEAAQLSQLEFLRELSRLQRRAMAGRLHPEECGGATLAFTSLAAAGVTRHVPLLPPFTSLIVAHSAPTPAGVLGATYDHRLLDGYQVARVLDFIATPPAP